jgi:hypothetical protein
VIERTFMTPLNESDELLAKLYADLFEICSALMLVGNDGLANKMGSIARRIGVAQMCLREGRDMALNAYE